MTFPGKAAFSGETQKIFKSIQRIFNFRCKTEQNLPTKEYKNFHKNYKNKKIHKYIKHNNKVNITATKCTFRLSIITVE